MNNNDNKAQKTPRHHYVHSIIEADMSENTMPPNAASSILNKILSFFLSYHNNTRRNKNG